MCFCIFNFFLTGFDIPDSPGCDNGHIRSKVLYCKLKTHLVVTLTCAAMADSVCIFLDCDVYKTFSNTGTCVACTEKIFLVNRTCLHCGDDVFIYIFFCKVKNVKLGSACLYSLFFKTFKLVILSYVTCNGDNLTVIVVFLKPRNND